jgi:hypothetical protein
VTADPSLRFTLLQRLVLAIVPRVVSALVWLCGLTWRFRVLALEGVTPTVFGEKSPANIYCFWHQCVLPCTVYFRYSHAVILISRSFDGEMITRILKMFGFDAVRGSSSRGAREGLLGLANVIKTGRTAIFTADGPRGPIYQTKMGPIKLAAMTGAPIGAFHLQPEHAWVFSSAWDRFLVPNPSPASASVGGRGRTSLPIYRRKISSPSARSSTPPSNSPACAPTTTSRRRAHDWRA